MSCSLVFAWGFFIAVVVVGFLTPILRIATLEYLILVCIFYMLVWNIMIISYFIIS